MAADPWVLLVSGGVALDSDTQPLPSMNHHPFDPDLKLRWSPHLPSTWGSVQDLSRIIHYLFDLQGDN